MLLIANGHLLRVVTASAGDVRVSGSRITVPTPFTPSSNSTPVPWQNAAITTATTLTPLFTATPSNFVDNVLECEVKNASASVSNAVRVERNDGSNTQILWQGTLLPGEWVSLNENGDWLYYGADGALKPVGTLNLLTLAAVGAAMQPASAADTINIFARKRAGRMHLKYIGPSGVDQTLQDKISENKWQGYLPNNGSTVGLNLGLGWTSGGTVSHPTPSSTAPALYSQQKRTRWANVVTTTNQFLGLRTATAEKSFWRGNAAGLGGWNFHARFAVGLWPAATVRLFVGLNDSNAGWAISDTLTGNGCGFWHDTTEAATVLTFVTRDGSTATKSAAITLGAALAAGQWFDAYIWCAPNGGSIGYALVDGATNTVLVDTTTSTTLPLTTAFLGPELAMSNGTANVTVTTTAFELSGFSCQADQ